MSSTKSSQSTSLRRKPHLTLNTPSNSKSIRTLYCPHCYLLFQDTTSLTSAPTECLSMFMYFPHTYEWYIQESFPSWSPLSWKNSAHLNCEAWFPNLDHFCHCTLTNISHPPSHVSSKTRHRIPVILLMPRIFLFLCNIYIAIQPKTTLQSRRYNENPCWDDSPHKFLSLLSDYQFEDSLLYCWRNRIPGSFVSVCMKNAFWWVLTILKSGVRRTSDRFHTRTNPYVIYW